ncbi:MAG TPA: Lrp/AsnC ligand binding domain-containing protein [Nitrososphaeraceae archaeon]|nr:Lrp/AsnC ligand binding domain-containing protein [Nitrososphaeraceae archaeon]
MLINCENHSEGEIIKELRKLPESVEVYQVYGYYDLVAKVYQVYGYYDLVAKVSTDTIDKLKETVS